MSRAGFGPQPAHRSGRRAVDHADQTAGDRGAAALKAAKAIWVPHPPQESNAARIVRLLDDNDGLRGRPMDGLRLSQDSHAGKTSMMERARGMLAERRRRNGLPANPHELLIVGLDKRISLKSVYQDILLKMGDDNWQTGSEKVLRQRIDEFVPRLGTKGICIDEVQHLRSEKGAVTDVTDALKRLLDLGIAPLICVGDLDSLPFFQRNKALAARLGIPMDLTPLGTRSGSEAADFKSFCRRYDDALVARGAVATSPGLTSAEMLTGLHAVSGGHVGRVARMLQHAAKNAAMRGAVTIERYDLSCVARAYAVPMWIDHDPFSGCR